LILENVTGFRNSDAHQLVLTTLNNLDYKTQLVELSPTDLGVPMRRPRLFLVATANGVSFKPSACFSDTKISLPNIIRTEFDDSLVVSPQDFQKYSSSLHIIDSSDDNACAICFTSGYWKSYRSSGSFIKIDGAKIRRFSPEEIVSLMGFSADFSFAPHLSISAKLHLAGNTVDVRTIGYILNGLSNLS